MVPKTEPFMVSADTNLPIELAVTCWPSHPIELPTDMRVAPILTLPVRTKIASQP